MIIAMARKNPTQDFRILRSKTTAQIRDSDPTQTEVRRIQGASLQNSPGRVPNISHHLRADFIKAIPATNDQGALADSQRRSSNHGSEPGIRATDERSFRMRRIRQRPKNIEHSGHTDLATGRASEPKGRVESWRESESDAGKFCTLSHLSGREIKGQSQRLEDVGRSRA